MSTIFTSIAVSLDGFIASKTGDLSWLNQAMVKGEDYGFDATMKRTGIYIMGANTYREMLRSGAAGGKTVYVVTKDKDLKKGTQTHLYDGSLKDLTARVRSETDKDIYIWGGGNLITQMIELDLLDELTMAVIPVLLGDGVPLFGKIRKPKKLVLSEIEPFQKSGIVILKYQFH